MRLFAPTVFSAARADCDAAAAKTVELGGSVSWPPTDIPVGRFAVLDDPLDAHFSVIRLTESVG